jgi:acyl-coenzyme A thioesterase PaaI-like protein
MDPKAKKSFTPSRPPDTITLVSLGTPGVSGHPSTAHGGLLATLFDEVQSIAMTLHLPPISPSEEEDLATRGGHTVYTAQLSVRYKAPVLVPGLLVIRSWCVARNGRKTWTIAQALQEDEADGQGHLEWTKRKRVRAESTALWIDVSVQPKL